MPDSCGVEIFCFMFLFEMRMNADELGSDFLVGEIRTKVKIDDLHYHT